MSNIAAISATPGTTAARAAGFGVFAFGALLGLYFGVLALVSVWAFTASGFARYWYFFVPLAAGFGIQVAIFVRLRDTLSRRKGAGTRSRREVAPISRNRWP